MNLLERVKTLCLEEGISQRKLESDLKLSNGATSKWGKSSPSADVLDKVADYFDVSTDYLLGKVPFKNDDEAYYSICVASVKYLIENQEVIPYYFDTYSGLYLMLDSKNNSYSASYAENLLNKFKKSLNLTNLELFELANIMFSEIKWTKDFDGIVYLKNFEDDIITIKLDFNIIDKLNKNKLNIGESVLLKSKNFDDNSFLKYESVFNEKDIDKSSGEPIKPTTIAAHLPDGVELTEEEQEQLDEYIQFILSRRKD